MSSLHASVTRVSSTGELILKVVNSSDRELTTDIRIEGVSKLAGPVLASVLASDRQTDENSLDHPTRVAPVTCSLDVSGSTISPRFSEQLDHGDADKDRVTRRAAGVRPDTNGIWPQTPPMARLTVP